MTMAIIVPKPYLKRYYTITAFVMGSLYFFANPISSDLYRHYQMREAMKSLPLTALFSTKEANYGNELLDTTITHYQLFALYTKLLSYLPKGFFMMGPCLVMYLAPLRFCFEPKLYDTRKWVYVLSYTYYLFSIDYVSLSAIRNIVTAMLFCLIMYEEIMHKANKVLCFIGYVLLLRIHSYASLLILTRVLTMLCELLGKRVKMLIIVFTVSGYTLLTSPLISNTLGRIEIFSHVINKLTEYSSYTGTTVNTRRYFMMLMYLIITVLLLLFNKYILRKQDENEQKVYGEWMTFLLLEIAYTIGSFAQYDTFIRGGFFIFPAFGVMLRKCLPVIGDAHFGDIRFTNYAERIIHTIMYVGTFSVGLILFAYFAEVGYLWLDNWFSLG